MVQDISDVATTVVPPKNAKGVGILQIQGTRDNRLSFFKLNVEFLAADDSSLGDGPLEISPGTLVDVIDRCYDAAKDKADDDGVTPTIPNPEDLEGPEIANPDYPIKPDAQQKWTAAQNQLNLAFENVDVTGAATFEDKMAAVAEILVAMLGNAKQNGTYPQLWGKQMLLDCFNAYVRGKA